MSKQLALLPSAEIALRPNHDCSRCELAAMFDPDSIGISGRKIGKGDTDVLVLGQCPTQPDDSNNQVFTGEIGALLAEGLKAAGIRAVWATNPVRCYVKSGVTIKPAWAKACRPYLDYELDKWKPKYILALGNVALMSTLKRANVTEAEGKEQWSEDLQAWIFPLRHPAAILRSMGELPGWMLNMQRFGRLVRGDLLDEPPVEVDVAWTVDEVLQFAKKLSHADRYAYDGEWKPVPWWHKDWVPYSFSFTTEKGRSTVIPLLHPQSPFDEGEVLQIMRALVEFMRKKSPRGAPWNGMADDLTIFRMTGKLPFMNYDPMAAWHAIDENSPKSQKWNTRTRLGWPEYEPIGGAGHDLALLPLDEVMTYNGIDSAGDFELWELAEATLATMPRVEAYVHRQVMPMIRSLERMVARGVTINRPLLRERIKEVRREMLRAKRMVPVENPGSSQQIGRWLYDQENLPILKLTKGGAPSTDAETLKHLALRFPTVRSVLNYRKPAKNLSTYLKPRVVDLDNSFDGLIHQDIRPTGTRTGRLSGPFHTTPRDPSIRSIYDAPPGWRHVTFDYAQIEARYVAWKAAGSPTTLKDAVGMLAAFAEGRDVYVETAAAILGKLESQVSTDKSDPQNERQIMGKVPTLAKIYSISAKGFREYAWAQFELEFSIGQAQMIVRKWDQKWPEIIRWHQWVRASVQERGWVMSDVGRVRHLPDAKGHGYQAEEAIRQAINSPIQDLASETTQRAHALYDANIDPKKAYVVANIHDALNSYVHEDHYDEVVPVIAEIMEYAPISLRDLGLHVPKGLIVAEGGVGPWGMEKKIPIFHANGKYLLK